MPSSLLSQFRLRHGSVASTASGRAGQPSGGSRSIDSNSNSGANNGEDDSLEEGNGSSLPGSPLASGQRRPRSESMDTDEQRAEKRQKQFIATLCTAKGFPADALDDFIGLTAEEMMISLRAEILELKMKDRKSAAQKFVESDDFKDILKDRLRACLLSPNLTAYVRGLGDQVWVFAKKNLQLFKIPEPALEDPEMSEKIILLTKDLLTSQRSNMKQKLANHIASQSHISVLAKALAPNGGYEITAAHWARIAFLRDSLAGYDAVVEQSRARALARAQGELDESDESDAEDGEDDLKDKVWSPSEFWEYVDYLLRLLRAEARKVDSTSAGRAKHLETFFTRCLQADMITYPGTVSSPAIPAFDKVTVPWQKAIHTGLIW